MTIHPGYQITVKGRVQGVGFRYYTLHKAKSLDLTGFVKNLANGDVYIEAYGHEHQLEIFLDWCRKGPSTSSVISCEYHKIESEQIMRSFQIQH